MDLTGKVALITGAAGGIGEATARSLAGLGATVVGVDVVDDRGEAIFRDLGAPHRYRHLDVTDEAAWGAVVKEVSGDLGGLDVVHLNAGVMLRPPDASLLDDPVQWMQADRYRRVLRINDDGVFFGVVASLPALEAHGGGDIVVTSSIAGISPFPPDPVYSMSKFALVGLVLSLAPMLVARGVRLNAVCPGGVDTPLIPADLKKMAPETLNPPSFIAGVVIQVLESGATGQLWVGMSSGPSGIWKYELAPLEPPAAG